MVSLQHERRVSTGLPGFSSAGTTPVTGANTRVTAREEDCAGTYPPLPAHIHGLRENGEWCICIQILKNGPATWPYTSSKTGRPSAPPPRSSAFPNPPYMQTQQKGTVPLVDSVTERQQSSESSPKPLVFARKSEITGYH